MINHYLFLSFYLIININDIIKPYTINTITHIIAVHDVI
jgi:hypothetical protein